MKKSRQLSILTLCAVAALGINMAACDDDAGTSTKSKAGQSCAENGCEAGLVCNADKKCEVPEDPKDEKAKLGEDCSAEKACEDGLECGDEGKCVEKNAPVDEKAKLGEDCSADKACDAGLECGSEGKCVEINVGPGPKEDPCEGVNCPDGKQCLNAQCFDPECIVDGAEKVCDSGKMCSKGECIDDGCQDKTCGEGEVCAKGLCEDALCLEKAIVCNDGSTCVKGNCIENECLEVTCDGGLTCSKGDCVYPACLGKEACASGKSCNEAGDCVFDTAPALKAEADTAEIDENGGAATISLSLNNPPSKDVSVTCTLTPEDAAEDVEVSCEGILFDALNYGDVQTIHLVGLPDNKIDPDKNFTLTITTVSEDPDFNGLTQSIDMVNKNVDTVGVTVNGANLTTSESGGSAVFSVVLKAKPEADVTFEVSSSNEAYGVIEGAADGKLVVTFTPENWDTPQEIKVVGQDDDENKNEADHTYQVVFSKTSSEDANYKDLDIPAIDVLNLDNDIAEAFLSKKELLTEEDGVQEDITIRLGLEPTEDVEVTMKILQSDKKTESAEVEFLTPNKITLNKDNYKDGVVISLKGVDDHIIDGDQDYYLRLRFSSQDDRYHSSELPDKLIPGKNIDKNVAAFVKTYSDLSVSEDMTSVDIGLALASIPTADVTVAISGSDKTEISVKPATMTFTAENWDKPQTITVTGVDDVVVDGNIVSEVRMKATSDDKHFGGDGGEIAALEDKIEITTLDNDVAAIVLAAEGAEISEDSGKNIEMKVMLSAQPETQVSVFAKSTDVSELKIISQPTLIFNEENWNVPQTVMLKVQDDNFADGTQTVFVDFNSISEDPLFNELTAKSPAYNVLDNESANVALTAVKTIFKPGEAMTSTVRVALSAPPEKDVPVKLSSSFDYTVKLSKSDLVFTTENWNMPQEVTFTVDPWTAPDNKFVTQLDALATGTGSYKNLKSNVVNVTSYAFLSQSFAYTGKGQGITLLPGRYKFEVWGAKGGSVLDGTGGNGGYSTGYVYLLGRSTLSVYVGGIGAAGGVGFNGGGYGHIGGGGATHIALGDRGELKNYASYQGDVFIVAGGGGGGERVLGGTGGGASGGNGDMNYGTLTKAPTGGTQTAGGTPGVSNTFGVGQAGSFGQGGSAQGTPNPSTGSYDAGGGGGGGWYGGGGIPYAGGGGGGSGFIGGVTGGSMQNGVQNGNGAAKITFVE